MDDTQKNKLVQNGNSNQVNGVSIAGSPNKEIQRPVADFVSHSEKPPILDTEVRQAGVEVVSQKPELTEEHEKLGVTHSLENNVPNLAPSGKIQLPMTQEEAEAEIAKDKGKISSNIGEHQEGNYSAPAALFLASLIIKIQKLKNLLFPRK